MPSPLGPPAVWVAGNQWSDITVPSIGEWEPTTTVSVVLPHFERPHELSLTLAGLSQQTYPGHLIQVIVADDGSKPGPPAPEGDFNFDLQVVTQEDRGYGLARARNLGAKAAEGDAIVFLDCDMIPETQHIEAHARWHHAARRLATVGFRYHTNFLDVSPDDVAAAVRDRRLQALAGTRIDRPEWIEGHMERTEDLLGPQDDLYLMMSGGNLGIDRDLYWKAGGNDETFTRWGGEDNEFAYRILQLGAVVVPERAAVAWHQGEGHEPSSEELHSIWLQQPKLRNLIANPSTRRDTPGRGYTVPRVVIAVSCDDQSAEAVGLTVDSLLASEFTDFVVGVSACDEPDAEEWLESSYQSDHRVWTAVDAPDLIERFPFAPIRMSLPAGYCVSPDTLSYLVETMTDERLGAIHLTLPGRPANQGGELLLTRAFNRAVHVDSDNWGPIIGELFGERWVSGSSAGIWRVEDADEGAAKIRARRRHFDQDDAEVELELVRSELEEIKSRRAVRMANAVGVIIRARTLEDFRTGLRSLARTLRRTPVS